MGKLTKILSIIAVAVVLAACQTGVQFANNDKRKPLQISADLSKPEGKGPFPAMVILHGCSGILRNAYAWADWFKARGYVTIIPDSLGPRSVSSICEDFHLVSKWDRFDDAYGAANYLASLPYVDKSRIGVMGFSNGGATALAVVDSATSPALDKNDQRFAVSIPLYPGCRVHPGPFNVPILVLIGELDDWTPAKYCEDLEKQVRPYGIPFIVKVYPGAEHGFDGDYSADLPNVRNSMSHTGTGATVGASGIATAQAKRDIEAFLKKYMGKDASS